ncbi:hypothetical protein [Nocardia bovistercoris]|uniref:Uncharacterized protein n=1 Tax=Nocardia bovistercoris TaxID=2785916 RepID=A0A931IA02_9NOCA|nr:hypothetical protein [Nocardia bovistercoris]MBH0777599.1 hypothetical protein [Nocardia bovistercoris]
MTDQVQALTQELRGVAGELDTASGHVQAILTTLGASRSRHWGAWGSDEFGENFSGGDGYVKSDGNLVAALESKITLLQTYATGLRDGATELDNMNLDNETTFQT